MQVLRGKDGSHATTWALKAALETLQANFDPITDLATGQDLLACMLYAQAVGDWDFSGMYTALLKHRVWRRGLAPSCAEGSWQGEMDASPCNPLGVVMCSLAAAGFFVYFCSEALKPSLAHMAALCLMVGK